MSCCCEGQDATAVDNNEKTSEYYMQHGEEIKLPEVKPGFYYYYTVPFHYQQESSINPYFTL